VSNPSPADVPGEDETTLGAGVPGPSGTGEQTDAGADPEAPTRPTTDGQEHA
jgi:hypothetical protein